MGLFFQNSNPSLEHVMGLAKVLRIKDIITMTGKRSLSYTTVQFWNYICGFWKTRMPSYHAAFVMVGVPHCDHDCRHSTKRYGIQDRLFPIIIAYVMFSVTSSCGSELFSLTQPSASFVSCKVTLSLHFGSGYLSWWEKKDQPGVQLSRSASQISCDYLSRQFGRCLTMQLLHPYHPLCSRVCWIQLFPGFGYLL